jgi:hypothetical protein
MITQNHISKSPLVELLGEEPHTMYTAAGQWTAPIGVKQIFIVMTGGGGAGGGGSSTWASGGGGGGGVLAGYYKVTPGETYQTRVGLGGRGATSTTTNEFGHDGQVTVFGNLIAFGGHGGGRGNSTTDAGSGGNGGYAQGFTFLTPEIQLPQGTPGQFMRVGSIASSTSAVSDSNFTTPRPGIYYNCAPGAPGSFSGGGGAGTRLIEPGRTNKGGAGMTGGGGGSLLPADSNGRLYGGGMGGTGLLGLPQEPWGQQWSNGGNGGLGGGGGGGACGESRYAGWGGDGVVMIWY